MQFLLLIFPCLLFCFTLNHLLYSVSHFWWLVCLSAYFFQFERTLLLHLAHPHPPASRIALVSTSHSRRDVCTNKEQTRQLLTQFLCSIN